MKLSLMLAAALAGALCAASPVQAADKLDLSTIKCKDFIGSSKENIGLILMWLEGYYNDEDAPPIVDFDKMKSDGTKLGEYCGKNPNDSLITASEEVMSK
jgi:acid stress chaperone HdeB